MSDIRKPLSQALRREALAVGLADGGISILHQDPVGRYDLVENLPACWPSADIFGRTDAETLPPVLAARFETARAAAREGGRIETIAFDLEGKEGRCQLVARFRPDGEGRGTIIVVIDVSERNERERALVALMREVSHRSKNLLAIVQSIAMQTALHTDGIDDYLARFRGRLHALASTQDLVTENDWRGTRLRPLAEAQLANAGVSPRTQVRFEGEDPLLGPNAALHIGLALHELAMNAALHGALAHGGKGEIAVGAELVRANGEEERLRVFWLESFNGMAEAVRVPRFGTLVLERVVPLSVAGTAELRLEPDGLRYRLDIPESQYRR